MKKMFRPFIYEEDDFVVMMTEQCNSNCIMCPMSKHMRQRGLFSSTEEWEEAFASAPESAPEHITITGGEPFLQKDALLRLFDYINMKWPESDVLVLTNGRALSIPSLFEEVKNRITPKYRFAIPIHASTPKLHDKITRTKGSFIQTINGLKNLNDTCAAIEIRLVVHKLNENDIVNVCSMLLHNKIRITRVNLLAMEMNGCAARNRDFLWSDYGELVLKAERGLLMLILHNVNVGLYNFPLCSVPRSLWSLTKNSISPEKVRYPKECELCSVKKACGGLFASTFHLGLFTPSPVIGD